jgi:hypothetical protein
VHRTAIRSRREIAPVEITEAQRLVLRHRAPLLPNEIVVETARLLGFSRTGGRLRCASRRRRTGWSRAANYGPAAAVSTWPTHPDLSGIDGLDVERADRVLVERCNDDDRPPLAKSIRSSSWKPSMCGIRVSECNRHRSAFWCRSDLLQLMRTADAFHAVPTGEIPLLGKLEPAGPQRRAARVGARDAVEIHTMGVVPRVS